MERWKRTVAHGLCVAQLGACASHPDSIEPRYVSPVAYQAWTCEQLGDERKRLEGEVTRISGLQAENANADAAMMGVGLILFWPVLFGLAATKDRKEELGRLKGEYDAVNEQTRMKDCPPPPPPTVEAEATPDGAAPDEPLSGEPPSAESAPTGS